MSYSIRFRVSSILALLIILFALFHALWIPLDAQAQQVQQPPQIGGVPGNVFQMGPAGPMGAPVAPGNPVVQNAGNVNVQGGANLQFGGPQGGVNNNQGSITLNNPLKAQSISQFLIDLIDVLLVFALPLIVLFIMYAGFLYVTAQGNAGKITTAHTALLWAVVGGVIVLGAKLIVTVIEGTINAF